MERWKKLLALLAAFCIAVLPVGMTVHAENRDKVVDNAGLLTDAEEEKLEELFSGIAEKYACDVVVLTTSTLDGKSPMNYTDDYYEEHSYGYGPGIDGIMLMVSMEDRDWWMATRGKAIRIFTDYGLEKLEGLFLGDLSDGEYYEAFRAFGEGAESFMEEAANDRPYDVNHPYRKPMALGVRLLIALAAGLAAAAAVFAALMAQLRTVRVKNQARDYVRQGSFHITRANDLFLYRTVSRRKIEHSSGGGGGGSSTHTTSSGGTAGGRGGKF